MPNAKCQAAIASTLTFGCVFYYIELTVGQGVTSEDLRRAMPPENMFVKVLYFATITSTTIGFGDEAPVTIAGRFVGALYMLFSTAAFGYVCVVLCCVVFVCGMIVMHDVKFRNAMNAEFYLFISCCSFESTHLVCGQCVSVAAYICMLSLFVLLVFLVFAVCTSCGTVQQC